MDLAEGRYVTTVESLIDVVDDALAAEEDIEVSYGPDDGHPTHVAVRDTTWSVADVTPG